MIIMQCDALISLVDDEYYDRAWCCVEAMMIRQAKGDEIWRVYRWYEHAAVVRAPVAFHLRLQDALFRLRRGRLREKPGPKWMLRYPRGWDVVPRTKKLTYEQDRPKIKSLERQCELLRKLGCHR